MSGLVSHSGFIAATWIAAIFGGIGIGAAFVSAIVGYRLTEDSLSDANTKISVARSEAKAIGDKAAADMAIANRAIVEARTETAKANERTAELKIELEERKNRRVTDAQKKFVIERLTPLPDKHKVVFNPLMGDGEAFQFSDQIQGVLKNAGYPVEEVPLKDRIMMLNRTGVFLWMKDANNPPERAKNIATAFRLVGITIWGESNSDFTDPDEVMLVVSTHP